MITELKDNQVFLYGAGNQNFCGAGAAGYAFSGTTLNDWRTCPLKQAAINHPDKINPKNGMANKIGRWCVWGLSDTFPFQTGWLGKSYAIRTVERPGGPRVQLKEIYEQFVVFIDFAKKNPKLEFLLTEIGTGYAGHSKLEIFYELSKAVDKAGGMPNNITRIKSYT